MSYASGRPHPNTILTPTSLDSTAHNVAYGSPTALAVKSEWGPDSGQSTAATPEDSSAHSKKKQKRNKPTLSCHECVERKTKVRLSSSRSLASCFRSSPAYCLHQSICTVLIPMSPICALHLGNWHGDCLVTLSFLVPVTN